MRHLRTLLELLVACFACAVAASAQTLPTGFVREIVVGPPFSGDPTAFARLPDGRTFLVERTSGNVRLCPATSTASTLLLTIPGVKSTGFEQGLLGVAVDPDWPARPYVYFMYTHVDSVSYITMYQASGDLTSPTSVNVTLSSPFHLITDIPDTEDFHNGGTLRFAPDGMLLACMGDDGQPCAAQQLGTLKGKIVRLDVSEMPGAGSGPPPKSDITPPDNPFSGPGDNERLVYAWGVRNPFRFTIDSETGDLVIGDVGQEFREEVDFMPVIQAGANFGWPIREGDVQGCCPTCPIGSAFTEPIYAYPHGGGPQAVIAGPLMRIPDGVLFPFPGSYDGSIFFAEFYEGWIRRMVQVDGVWQFAPQVPGQPSALNWAQGMPSISDFQMGADGAIYFCKISGVDRGVYRIRTSIPLGVEVGDAPSSMGPRVAVDPTPVRAGSGARITWAGARGPVSLSIVDAAGRRVAALVHGDVRNAGHLHWDGGASNGSALPAGVYFVRLTSGSSRVASSKLIVVR